MDTGNPSGPSPSWWRRLPLRVWLIAAGGTAGLAALSWVFFSTRLVQVLVVGADAVDYSRHADTMLLVTFRPSSKQVHVLSIPRDTMVVTKGNPRGTPGGSGNSTKKIGEVFAYGWNHGGVEVAAQLVLEHLSEWLDMPLHHYCVVEYKGFERAVDELGGVEVDIPRAMDYDDDAANLHIHLPTGRRLLSGREALQFVRYRADKMGDVGRIARQQQFLRAVKDRLDLSAVPGLVRVVFRHVKTNIPTTHLLQLAKQVGGWNRIGLITATLPGEMIMQNRISYWKVNLPAMSRLRSDLLNL